MYKINYIEHSADIGFKVSGDSLEDVFTGGLLEMFHNLILINNPQKLIKKTVKIKGQSNNELLFNSLKYFLDYFYIKGFVPVMVNKIKIRKNTVRITAEGEFINLYDNKRECVLQYEIKSVTYHKLDIIKKDNKYSTILILDV